MFIELNKKEKKKSITLIASIFRVVVVVVVDVLAGDEPATLTAGLVVEGASFGRGAAARAAATLEIGFDGDVEFSVLADAAFNVAVFGAAL